MPPQALEQSLDSLALTSFGVMDTTLEEVFLKVSEEDQSQENSDAGETMFPACLQIAQHLHIVFHKLGITFSTIIKCVLSELIL